MTAAMVFAAGLGTRMRPLTHDRPKALVRVAGRALVDHALDQVAGAAPIVVNAHHHADMLAAHLAGRRVRVLREAPALLDTGGGLRHALPLLGPGPVVTTNSDSIWTGPTLLATLTAAWDPEAMDALLLLVPPARAIGTGGRRFAIGPGGRVSPNPDGLIATGACMMRTEAVAADPRAVFSLLDAWMDAMARGRLCGVEHPGRWCDVGAPDRIAPAEAMLAGAAA